MKILVTKTSEFRDKEEMEVDHLEDCINLLNEVYPDMEYIIAKPSDNRYSQYLGRGDFIVEIYDDYRE